MERIIVNRYRERGIFGGKEAPGTWQKIINEIRPHEVFISLFLGHCAIVRNIRRSGIVIGCDIDPGVIQAWKEMHFPWLDLRNVSAHDILSQLPTWFPTGMFPGKKVCLYCDPPYRLTSRKNPVEVYDYEMTDKQHEAFLKEITSIAQVPNIDILISHYPDEMYDQYLHTWRKISYQTTTRQGSARENLYMNYKHKTGELQDYRWVGDNKDERYNLKHRTAKNLIRKLENMDKRKRQAVLHYMRDWLSSRRGTA